MATRKSRIAGTAEAWETGALGEDQKHAKRAAPETAKAIDDALGLQPISIRLPKSVIETYKLLATVHGVGYQPLMRDAICRFAESEMKQVLIATVEAQRQAEASKQEEPAAGCDEHPMPKAA